MDKNIGGANDKSFRQDSPICFLEVKKTKIIRSIAPLTEGATKNVGTLFNEHIMIN